MTKLSEMPSVAGSVVPSEAEGAVAPHEVT